MRVDQTPQDKEGIVEKGIVTGGNPSATPSEVKKDDSIWKKYLPYIIGVAITAAIITLTIIEL